MISLILLASLTCPDPIIINRTDVFDSADVSNLEVAKTGCKRHYSENHCLHYFVKKAESTYQAICVNVENWDDPTLPPPPK